MSTRRGCLGLALLISHLLFTFTCRPFAFGSYHLHFVYLSGASRRRAVYSDVSGGFVASRPLFDAVLGGLHGGTSSPWLWAQDKSVSSP